MFLLIILGVILVGIIVGVILYYGARFMKGKLALELPRSTVQSGEPLSGRVNLTVKKSIRGLLRVSLIAREKQRGRGHHRSSGDRNSSSWLEVYRKRIISSKRRGTSQWA